MPLHLDAKRDRALIKALAGQPSTPAEPEPAKPARVASGERTSALDTLAARGYTLLVSTPGDCYLVNVSTGARTPVCATYGEALDAALALEVNHG